MDSLTTEQTIILALIFLAGLVIGLAMRPGGPKWKQRYEDERAAHMALVRQHDTTTTRSTVVEPRSTTTSHV